MGLNDFTVYDVLRRSSELFPARTALSDGERRVSYAEFRGIVESLAHGIRLQGVVRGDRIATVAQNSIESLALYFASSCLGTIIVPLNTRLSEQELTFILRDANPVLVFADYSFHDLAYKIASGLSGLKGLFSTENCQTNFKAFSDLLIPGTFREESETNSEDIFAVLYTAAVRGNPRGAAVTNANVLGSIVNLMSGFQLGPKDTNLNILPYFHVAGLISALLTFHVGGLNVASARFNPEEALEIIAKEKVSLLVTFPPILSLILDSHDRMNTNISSLRYVLGMDHPDNIHRLKRKCGAKFMVGYGQAETSFLVTLGMFDEKPGSVGRPTPLARLKIVDDYECDVPTGSTGEIVVRGPLVFKGYFNLEEDTEYTFRNGWHHTGDAGYLDSEGYLWYVKRKEEKELIKSGGENVYPAEVEKILLEHPDVVEACVFGVPDKEWGEAVKAACVPKQGSSLDARELIEFVGSRIARYKKPRYVVIVDPLPRTADGVIDRETVKAKYGTVF